MPSIISYENEEQWLRERLKDVTSTEASALFDLNPYMVKPELWHIKKAQQLGEWTDNERMKWGRYLEPVIAEGIAEEYNFVIKPMKAYYRNEELRMGSSFDYEITHPVNAILEIKNVDWLVFKDKWVVEDGKVVEAPPHIEIQLQHQMAVSEKQYAYIGVLVGGNELYLVARERNENMINRIKEEVAKFWQSIEANEPPAWNFQRDADFIAKLYNFAEPGKIIDDEDGQYETMVEEFTKLGKSIKDLEGRRSALKAEMLTMMGDTEKILGGTYTISASLVGETEVSYTRKPYRTFRVTRKKPKVVK